MEIVELILKCIFFYVIIVVALRVMGKREVGELSVLDMVVFFVMSEILALTITESNEIIIKALIAILTWVILQRGVAYVCMKKKNWRDFFEGVPNIIIQNGIVNQETMRKQRYTLDDLLFQLREQAITSPEEVEYAILENSGVLTVIKKKDCKVKWPYPLISDGALQKEALNQTQITEEELLQQLRKEGCDKIEEVFLCLAQNKGLYVVKKQEFKRMK